MIKKIPDGWQVTSKDGRNLGIYKTRAEAEERLRKVEFFKRNKGKNL